MTLVIHEPRQWWQVNAVPVGHVEEGISCVVDLAELVTAASDVGPSILPLTRHISFTLSPDELCIGATSVRAIATYVPPPPPLDTAREVDALRIDLAGASLGDDAWFEVANFVVRLPADAYRLLVERGVSDLRVFDANGTLFGFAAPRDAVGLPPALRPVVFTILNIARERVGEVEHTESSFEHRRRYLDREPPLNHHTRTGDAPGIPMYVAALTPGADENSLLEIIDWADGDIRETAASNPGLPAWALRALAVEDNADVRAGAARNPKLSDLSLLEHLARDPSPRVRAGVASNPNISPSILRALADDPRGEVRAAVARNPRTEADVVMRMAQDHDWLVRQGAAENRSLTDECLRRLGEDPNDSVREAVAQNTGAPDDTLWNLVESWPTTHLLVASNPTAPQDLLDVLADHLDAGVRSAVAHNRSTTPNTLARLANDTNDVVLRAVTDNPLTPRRARREARRHSEW